MTFIFTCSLHVCSIINCRYSHEIFVFVLIVDFVVSLLVHAFLSSVLTCAWCTKAVFLFFSLTQLLAVQRFHFLSFIQLRSTQKKKKHDPPIGAFSTKGRTLSRLKLLPPPLNLLSKPLLHQQSPLLLLSQQLQRHQKS